MWCVNGGLTLDLGPYPLAGCSVRYSAGLSAKDTPRTYVSSICLRTGSGIGDDVVPGDEEEDGDGGDGGDRDGDGDGGDGDGDGALTEGAGEPATVDAGGETSKGVCGT